MTERFYPSIVTTDKNHFEKIREAKDLGLQTVCVFLTGIDNRDETEALLAALRESTIGWVPLVHLRTDSLPSDVEFFMEHFKTGFFNTHPSYNGQPINPDLEIYKDKICLENVGIPLDKTMITNWGGICVDFTHLEGERRVKNGKYFTTLNTLEWGLEARLIKVAHISANRKKMININGQDFYDSHLYIKRDTDFDYLDFYSYLFPDIMAIELENSLEEQRKIIAKLEKNYPEGGETLWQNSQVI